VGSDAQGGGISPESFRANLHSGRRHRQCTGGPQSTRMCSCWWGTLGTTRREAINKHDRWRNKGQTHHMGWRAERV